MGYITKTGACACIALLFFFLPAALWARGQKDTSSDDNVLIKNDGASYTREAISGDPVQFDEIWGFVSQYHLDSMDYSAPLTDIGFYSSTINSYGELSEIPSRNSLASFTGRVHLVFSSENRALVNFILDPRYGLRNTIEDSLIAASAPFDGLIIDLEYIPGRDRDYYLSFLGELRDRLAGKMLSVCVPARTKTITDDMFPYEIIGTIADRVIVMAYDEHWSTSMPGPVASLEWCGRIADYALTVIPQKKLVMGLPLYGRTWTDDTLAGAWKYSSLNRQLAARDITGIEREEDGTARVEFTASVKVTGFFDDAYSLVLKCRQYKAKNIGAVAFWRIGLEDTDIWNWIDQTK